MKVFVNSTIDPTGGFSEAGVLFEQSLERFSRSKTIYAMSCGTPVPNNNAQEIAETAWLIKHLGDRKLVIDQWYSGTIGKYAAGVIQPVSDEACMVLDMDIPPQFRAFQMLSEPGFITRVREKSIQEWCGHFWVGTIPEITFSHRPLPGYTLTDLLEDAKEGESIMSYICPFASIEAGREVVRCIRKSGSGWCITAERAQAALDFPKVIEDLLESKDLAELQRLLGVSINGKATFRLYSKMLTADSEAAIILRDYSNARGTLQQCSKNFGEKLIISKRIYVESDVAQHFTQQDSLINEPPFSKGETVMIYV